MSASSPFCEVSMDLRFSAFKASSADDCGKCSRLPPAALAATANTRKALTTKDRRYRYSHWTLVMHLPCRASRRPQMVLLPKSKLQKKRARFRSASKIGAVVEFDKSSM